MNSTERVTETAAGPTADGEPAVPGTAGRLRNRWLLIAVAAAGYVLHLAWRLWLARGSIAPAAHPDEDGYLLVARALSGGAGGFSYENAPFLRHGYSLLLTPVYLGTHDAFTVYRRALLLNSIIGAAAVPLGMLFARRVLDLPRWWAAGAGLTAAALPAVVYYAGMVMTDAILPALALAWLVLLHAWIAASSRRRRWGYAIGSGTLAGLIYTIHVRGTMVLLVHCTIAFGLLLPRRSRRLSTAGSLIAAVAVAGVNPLCKWALGDSIAILGIDPNSQITAALRINWQVAQILLRTVGQVWYLSAGTLGFGAVGLIVVLGQVLGTRSRRAVLARPGGTARLVTLLATLAVTLLIAAGSSASLPFGEHRITYFVYARYLHFLFPVWFLIGLAALRGARPWRRAGLAASAGVVLLTSAWIVAWRTGQAYGYRFVAFDTPELQALSGRWLRFTVWPPTWVALGLFAALVACLFARRTAGLVLPVVLGLCLVAAPMAQRRILDPMIAYQYRPDTPRLVRDLHLGPPDVVAEAWQLRYPTPLNHSREVGWQRLMFFDANRPPPSAATVVIAPWNPYQPARSWNGAGYGMRRIGVDNLHGWAAWRRG